MAIEFGQNQSALSAQIRAQLQKGQLDRQQKAALQKELLKTQSSVQNQSTAQNLTDPQQTRQSDRQNRTTSPQERQQNDKRLQQRSNNPPETSPRSAEKSVTRTNHGLELSSEDEITSAQGNLSNLFSREAPIGRISDQDNINRAIPLGQIIDIKV